MSNLISAARFQRLAVAFDKCWAAYDAHRATLRSKWSVL